MSNGKIIKKLRLLDELVVKNYLKKVKLFFDLLVNCKIFKIKNNSPSYRLVLPKKSFGGKISVAENNKQINFENRSDSNEICYHLIKGSKYLISYDGNQYKWSWIYYSKKTLFLYFFISCLLSFIIYVIKKVVSLIKKLGEILKSFKFFWR